MTLLRHPPPPPRACRPECLHEKREEQEEVVESIEIRDDKVGRAGFWAGGVELMGCATREDEATEQCRGQASAAHSPPACC